MNIAVVGCGNIGFETVRSLMGEHRMFVFDVVLPKHLEQLLTDDHISFFQCDAQDEVGLGRALDENLRMKDIGIDVLVSTVGAQVNSCEPLENFEGYRKNFELNVFGNLVPIKAFLGSSNSLKVKGVIVISSSSAHFAPRSLYAYAPAKWALETVCSSLRNEMRGRGVSVDVIAPRTLQNRYSSVFQGRVGLAPETVARKICQLVRRPENSTHYIPQSYRALHIIERVCPLPLDIKLGLKGARGRKRRHSQQKVGSVLITGASSGLGLELARAYSQTCRRMYLVSRNYEKLLDIKEEISGSSKCTVEIARLDVSDHQAVIEYASSIDDVDLVINNAGYSVIGNVIDIPVSEYRKNYDTNFLGPVLLTSCLLRREHRPKKIINVLSTTAIIGKGTLSSYASSKSALWCFTRSVRRAYGNDIQVLEVIPSTFTSNLGDNAKRVGPTTAKAEGRKMGLIDRALRPRAMSSEHLAAEIQRAERKGVEVLYEPLTAKLFSVVMAMPLPSLDNVMTAVRGRR